jgi:putative hydrolases of HD superfamily
MWLPLLGSQVVVAVVVVVLLSFDWIRRLRFLVVLLVLVASITTRCDCYSASVWKVSSYFGGATSTATTRTTTTTSFRFHHHPPPNRNIVLSSTRKDNSNNYKMSDPNESTSAIGTSFPPSTTSPPPTATSTYNSTTTTTSTTVSLIDALSFISDICGKLKQIKRTGWVRSGIPFPESDADHMHRCAMCALLVTQHPPDPRDDYTSSPAAAQFHPALVDTTKLLRMAVTHDVCEALAGDVTPFCNSTLVQNKHAQEQAAMQHIQQSILGVTSTLGQDLMSLWEEYEAQETVEAIYCKDIDKFEMVVQAYEYEKAHLQYKNKSVPSSDDTAKEEEQEGTSAAKNHDEDELDEGGGGEPDSKKQKTREAGVVVDDNDDNVILQAAMDPSTTVSTTTTTTTDTEEDEATTTTTTTTTTSTLVLAEPLRTFFESTRSTIQTPLFRRLDREVRQRRRQLLQERGWHVTEQEE